MFTLAPIVALSLAASVAAYEIPSNLQHFYNGVKNGGCTSFVDGHDNLKDGETPETSGFGFCNEHEGVVYLAGKNSLGDMDVDCDGSTDCADDPTHQSQTAFDDILTSQNYGIKSLNAGTTTFAVLGTCNTAMDVPSGGPIEPLSVMAIVCNNQLHYAVFGDTSGCDNDNWTGEASISLARICFPDANPPLGGDNGYTGHDILYLAFTGKDAIVGPHGGEWTTNDPKVFEASIKAQGDKMIQKVFGNAGGNPNPTCTDEPTPTCTGEPTPPQTSTLQAATCTPTSCSWAGHCLGAPCTSFDDCDGSLICTSGKCTVTGCLPA